MQTLKHNIRIFILSLVFGLVIGGGLIIARAWTEPTVAPPGGNIGAPINTSATGQTKSGNLIINSDGAYQAGLTVNRDLIVSNGNVGIGAGTLMNPISAGLKLDVEGKVGATEYCDENGNNCKTVSALAESKIEKFYLVGSPNSAPGKAFCHNVNGTTPSGAQLDETYPFTTSSSARNQNCMCSTGYTRLEIAYWSGYLGWSSQYVYRQNVCIKL